ncbi:MAG: hypothetical protein JNM79_08230 [Burkholderiales bacterium]|nr:hypothetical protein [Burkholderiales bacterium]
MSSVALRGQARPGWLARIAEDAVLATMAVLLPLSPLVSALLAQDAGYLRRFGGTLGRCARMLLAMRAKRVVARRLERAFGRAGEFQHIEGQCTHCGACCIDRTCVFLRFDAAGSSSCAIHGSAFFRTLSCASYPVTGDEIALYDCPSFRVVSTVAAPRRVIPIRKSA